jgi:predicted nucleic acid-binding protein
MPARRISIDTNILVYALDKDAGDRHKVSVDVLEHAVGSDCVLTTQALGEFFHVVTRKNRMPAMDAAQKEAGVTHLLTEDMQDRRSILGVRLVNPFKLNIDRYLS